MTRRLDFYFTCLIKNIPVLIPLKIPHLLRCFDFLVPATYAKYASFLGNLAPCI
jgi:hypothetical protein